MGTEIRTSSASGGEKGVKPERYDLIPVDALEQVALVYGYGVEKYKTADYEGPDQSNWRKGYEWSKNYAAMQRHLAAFWRGEEYDPESGLPHLGHAAWHAMTLLAYMLDKEKYGQFDDRDLGTSTGEGQEMGVAEDPRTMDLKGPYAGPRSSPSRLPVIDVRHDPC